MSIFLQRLESLMLEKQINDKQLIADLNIGKNSLTYWRKNDNIPNGEILSKLSNYFNVTTDYLIGKENTPQGGDLLYNVDKIFELLRNRKLEQKDLAKAIGASTGNITDWKKGRTKPSDKVMQKIADYFHLPLSDFYVYDESPENKKDLPAETGKSKEGEQKIVVYHRNGKTQEYYLTEEQTEALTPLLEQLNKMEDPDF